MIVPAILLHQKPQHLPACFQRLVNEVQPGDEIKQKHEEKMSGNTTKVNTMQGAKTTKTIHHQISVNFSFWSAVKWIPAYFMVLLSPSNLFSEPCPHDFTFCLIKTGILWPRPLRFKLTKGLFLPSEDRGISVCRTCLAKQHSVSECHLRFQTISFLFNIYITRYSMP